MPQSTQVIPLRVQHELAARIRAAAVQSGLSTNRYLTDLIGAVLGAAQKSA